MADTGTITTSSQVSNFEMVGQVASGIGTITNSLLTSRANRKAAKANAAAYGQQMALYGQQMAMQLKAANAYSGAARRAKEVGQANAKEARLRASYIQEYEDFALEKANKERRQIIGQGKVSFAANGVLLEARKDSAVAMWEQDEAADAAIEKLQIMQQAEDEAYGYLKEAQHRLAEGYAAAANYYGQASSAAAEAVQSALGNQQALANKIAAEKAAKKRKGFGSIIGGAAGAIVGAFGGPAGAAIGFNIGAQVGGAADSF